MMNKPESIPCDICHQPLGSPQFGEAGTYAAMRPSIELPRQMCMSCADKQLAKEVLKGEYNRVVHMIRTEERMKILARVVEIATGMKVKTCDCESEDGLGYHTKECDMAAFGYNHAITDLLASLKEI